MDRARERERDTHREREREKEVCEVRNYEVRYSRPPVAANTSSKVGALQRERERERVSICVVHLCVSIFVVLAGAGLSLGWHGRRGGTHACAAWYKRALLRVCMLVRVLVRMCMHVYAHTYAGTITRALPERIHSCLAPRPIRLSLASVGARALSLAHHATPRCDDAA